jgi:hypothetical protein
LHLPGKYSTMWASPPALFCFSYFLGRVLHFCPGLASDQYPPTYASHVAGIIDVPHHTWIVYWDGPCYLFAQAGLKPRSFWYLLPE